MFSLFLLASIIISFVITIFIHRLHRAIAKPRILSIWGRPCTRKFALIQWQRTEDVSSRVLRKDIHAHAEQAFKRLAFAVNFVGQSRRRAVLEHERTAASQCLYAWRPDYEISTEPRALSSPFVHITICLSFSRSSRAQNDFSGSKSIF